MVEELRGQWATCCLGSKRETRPQRGSCTDNTPNPLTLLALHCGKKLNLSLIPSRFVNHDGSAVLHGLYIAPLRAANICFWDILLGITAVWDSFFVSSVVFSCYAIQQLHRRGYYAPCSCSHCSPVKVEAWCDKRFLLLLPASRRPCPHSHRCVLPIPTATSS